MYPMNVLYAPPGIPARVNKPAIRIYNPIQKN